MPPRPRQRLSNRDRYERVPGSARRYRDRVTGEEISYDAYYRRTKGEPRRETTARRLGFESAGARRRYNTNVVNRLRAQGRLRQNERQASATLRRRSQFAARWAESQQRNGVIIPLTTRGRVNRTQAMANPEFQALYARFLELQRERNVDRMPSGELAQIMTDLGMRPPDYPYMVGDSPPGTADATYRLTDPDADVAEEARLELYGPEMETLPAYKEPNA